MFALPQYWWILVLALVPQVAFLVCLSMYRGLGKIADKPMPKWSVWMLSGGAVIGCGYGLVQSDFIFLLGQSCVLVIAFARLRHQPTENE